MVGEHGSVLSLSVLSVASLLLSGEELRLLYMEMASLALLNDFSMNCRRSLWRFLIGRYMNLGRNRCSNQHGRLWCRKKSGEFRSGDRY